MHLLAICIYSVCILHKIFRVHITIIHNIIIFYNLLIFFQLYLYPIAILSWMNFITTKNTILFLNDIYISAQKVRTDSLLELTVGFKPTTCWLLISCSINWAKLAYIFISAISSINSYISLVNRAYVIFMSFFMLFVGFMVYFQYFSSIYVIFSIFFAVFLLILCMALSIDFTGEFKLLAIWI